MHTPYLGCSKRGRILGRIWDQIWGRVSPPMPKLGSPLVTPLCYSFCIITVKPPLKYAYTIFGVLKKGSDFGSGFTTYARIGVHFVTPFILIHFNNYHISPYILCMYRFRYDQNRHLNHPPPPQPFLTNPCSGGSRAANRDAYIVTGAGYPKNDPFLGHFWTQFGWPNPENPAGNSAPAGAERGPKKGSKTGHP